MAKQLTKNFHQNEFECSCGCGYNNISLLLVGYLQKCRDQCNFTFLINSGCRCQKHNFEIGGVKNSEHLTGEAVDIRITNSNHRFLLLKSAFEIGFTRIGIGSNFIHLGVGLDSAQKVVWLY